MKQRYSILWLIPVFLFSCVSTQTHVVGHGSSVSQVSRTIAEKINKKYDISQRNIQISPNNFWESNTKLNLPLSSVLCDALSAEFSKLNAKTTLQETGEQPLRIIGSYQTAQNDVIITVKLRTMGDTSSTDLAVVQERISKNDMDSTWLEPQFERIARTLVRLLEEDYSQIHTLKVTTKEFVPGIQSQPELAIGSALVKHIRDAMGSSAVFTASGTAQSDAALKGDYTILDNKIVFHASIMETRNNQNIAGATFQIERNQIPQTLLSVKIQSLDDLTAKITDSIMNSYAGIPTIQNLYISPKNFLDPSLKAVVPLSGRLAEKFINTFSKTRHFKIMTSPQMDTNLMLTGELHREDGALSVHVSLNKIKVNQKGLFVETIATGEAALSAAYCQNNWFDISLSGKTDYLMQRLEKKSTPFLSSGNPCEIVINRFKYQNSKHYSQFSDYLEGYMLDYFAASRFFTPVKNVEQRLSTIRTRGIRSIVPTKKTGATVAALANAAYYIEGSFWPSANGNVEIKAVLSSVKGQILASEHVVVKKGQVNPKWLETSVPKNFSENLALLSDTDARLSVELLTQKGRNNLSFTTDEEILFLLKANKDVYVKLYTADADNNIFRIYPNEFTSSTPLIRAGEVTSIPNNTYAGEYSFQVQGKTGNEMVFAFASGTSLPDLPGSSDTGFYGMRKVNLNIKQIKQWFSDYALQRGISLSWDSLPIRTYQ